MKCFYCGEEVIKNFHKEINHRVSIYEHHIYFDFLDKKYTRLYSLISFDNKIYYLTIKNVIISNKDIINSYNIDQLNKEVIDNLCKKN